MFRRLPSLPSADRSPTDHAPGSGIAGPSAGGRALRPQPLRAGVWDALGTGVRALLAPPLGAAAGALVATSLAGALVAPAGAQAVERRTLPGREVAVYHLVGQLRVVGGTGRDVVVEVTRRGRDADAIEIAQGEVRGRPALRVFSRERRLVYPALGRWSTVRTDLNDDGTFGGGNGGGFWRGASGVEIRGSGRGAEAWADVTVSVPRGQQLTVHLAAGAATVSNVDGELTVDVQAASVTTERTRGRLTVDAGSGTVRVADADGELVLDTGSGEVTVERVRGPRLRVDAGSGSVVGRDIDAALLDLDLGSGSTRLGRLRTRTMSVDAGSGGVDLELTDDVEDVRVDAGSGAITLRLPPSLGASVDIGTGSGGIVTELPITVSRRERDRLVGRIGDGQGRIKIDTGSGGVRLLRTGG